MTTILNLLSIGILFIEFLFFFSSFYKTTALTKFPKLKRGILRGTIIDMLKSFDIFVKYFVAYFLIIFMLIVYVSYYIMYNSIPAVNIFYSDINSIDLSIIKYLIPFEIEISSYIFPFSFPSAFFMVLLFLTGAACSASSPVLCFPLRPLRYHFWEKLRRSED